MVLFDYLIKLLVHNSETMFIGLLVVLVGYNGWQLYYLKKKQRRTGEEKKDDKLQELDKEIKQVKSLLQQLEGDCSDLKEQFKNNRSRLREIKEEYTRFEDRMSLLENNLYSRFTEKTSEIKETLKLLLSCYRGEEEQLDDNLLE